MYINGCPDQATHFLHRRRAGGGRRHHLLTAHPL